MQSYGINTVDNQISIELFDTPVPIPGPNQVLIRVHAAGLNRGEFIAGHGIHAKEKAIKVGGGEGAGEVIKLGAGVEKLKIGARVMGRCVGAFAQYSLMEASDAMLVPTNLSWEEAAATPLTFMVVYDMLVLQGRLRPDEWLLVTGISSGVGVAALQTAKALGAKVVGTSGSSDKIKRLKEFGLDVGLCTRNADFYDDVLLATEGKGINLVVNTVGGSMFSECVRTLAFEGRLATVGYVDGQMKSEIDIDALHSKRLTLFGVSNKLRNAKQRAETVSNFASNILPMFADSRIRPIIDKIYPFDQLKAAKAYMESNLHMGKIVISI
jgi:NADPH2:quinone reductase